MVFLYFSGCSCALVLTTVVEVPVLVWVMVTVVGGVDVWLRVRVIVSEPLVSVVTACEDEGVKVRVIV